MAAPAVAVSFFGSVAAPAALGAGVGVGLAAAPGVAVFGAFGSVLGMLGRRCERISAARSDVEPVATAGVSSVILVITSTSSSRRRSAAGLTLMLMKGSLSRSGLALVTV